MLLVQLTGEIELNGQHGGPSILVVATTFVTAIVEAV